MELQAVQLQFNFRVSYASKLSCSLEFVTVPNVPILIGAIVLVYLFGFGPSLSNANWLPRLWEESVLYQRDIGYVAGLASG